MEHFPFDDILGSLYKLRIRESDKLKTVLELYNLEIHQKKTKPDYHRLKTMVKRSIEQDLRTRNFEATNGRIEWNMLVKNQRVQRRVLKGQGECWQWQANGHCSKGDTCSFRHDGNERAKATTPPAPSPEPSTQRQVKKNSARSKSPRGRSLSWRISRLPCSHLLEGTISNPSCENWHSPECVFYKTKEGCKFVERCSFAHRWVQEQPSKGLKKNGFSGAVASLKETENLGCVSQDMLLRRSSSILRKSSTMPKPMRCVRSTKAVLRNASERDHKPSLNKICQEILISVAQTLQNLRIGLRRRQSGKSIGLAKQRGGWQRKSWIREVQSYILLTCGKVVSPFTIQN